MGRERERMCVSERGSARVRTWKKAAGTCVGREIKKRGRDAAKAHFEVDGLCVASSLCVEDPLMVPAVLVVPDERALGVGRESGLASA